MNKSQFFIIIEPFNTNIINNYKNIINNLKNTNIIQIDDYIELDDSYIIQSLNILNNNKNIFKDIDFLNLSNDKINKYFNKKFIQKIDHLAKEYEQVYYNIKNQYDDILKNHINICLKKRENIILKITSYNNFDWLYNNTILLDTRVRDDYEIIYIYPYITNNNLIKQVLSEFLINIKSLVVNYNYNFTNNKDIINDARNGNIINNTLIKIPRIFSLIHGKFSLYNSNNNIQDTIAYYIDKCVNDKTYIDKFIMYDNNDINNQILIFDILCNCNKKDINNININYFNEKYFQDINKSLSKSLLKILKFC